MKENAISYAIIFWHLILQLKDILMEYDETSSEL